MLAHGKREWPQRPPETDQLPGRSPVTAVCWESYMGEWFLFEWEFAGVSQGRGPPRVGRELASSDAYRQGRDPGVGAGRLSLRMRVGVRRN